MAINLTSDCMAHYKLDDCALTATIIDSRGFSHGTSVRNTNFMAVAGKVGGALAFNGTSDYIVADVYSANLFAPTYRNSFSISFWCKPDDGQAVTYQGLFGDNGSECKFHVRIDDAGKITVYYQIDSDEGGVACTSDNENFTDGLQDWGHIVVVITKTGASSVKIDIYFNNVLTGTTTSDHITMSSFTHITTFIGLIGNDEDPDFTIPFVGSLDNVTIFNKALSTDEIAFLYNGGAGTEELSQCTADSIDEAIHTALCHAEDSPVMIALGYVEDKIYLHNVPQSVSLPAITYQRIATEFNHTSDDTIELRRATYQFTCWS